MADPKRIWLHAAHSVKLLFVALLLGLVLIDLLARYVSLSIFSLVMLAVVVVVPSMVSVRIVHSETPDLYYLPAAVIAIVGGIIVAVLALGCDVGFFYRNCHGGLAGPLTVLGVMFSWAGITFAFGLGSHKKMLKEGKLK